MNIQTLKHSQVNTNIHSPTNTHLRKHTHAHTVRDAAGDRAWTEICDLKTVWGQINFSLFVRMRRMGDQSTRLDSRGISQRVGGIDKGRGV